VERRLLGPDPVAWLHELRSADLGRVYGEQHSPDDRRDGLALGSPDGGWPRRAVEAGKHLLHSLDVQLPRRHGGRPARSGRGRDPGHGAGAALTKRSLDLEGARRSGGLPRCDRALLALEAARAVGANSTSPCRTGAAALPYVTLVRRCRA